MKSFGKVLIIGDSYSAFRDYGPDEYAVYYSANEKEGHVFDFSVDDMWWKKLINETGSTYLYNCSYSGSTVCYHGYDLNKSKGISFIERFKYCSNEKIKEAPDTVIIFGATNDSWANAGAGEEKYKDWTEEDLYKFAPGFCYLLHLIKNKYPEAKIINITNTNLKPEIVNSIRKICDKEHIKNIELDNIEKIDGHPTKLGMTQIKEQILRRL